MNVVRYMLNLAKQAVVFTLCGSGLFIVGIFVGVGYLVDFWKYPGTRYFHLVGALRHLFIPGCVFGFGIWLAYRFIWAILKQPDPLLVRQRP